jgi:hypothetical protein
MYFETKAAGIQVKTYVGVNKQLGSISDDGNRLAPKYAHEPATKDTSKGRRLLGISIPLKR